MSIEIGKVVSEELSDLLRSFSTSDDRADISRQTNISASSLREITYRKQSITDRSLPAVKLLLEKAEANAKNLEAKSKKGKRDLKTILDTI